MDVKLNETLRRVGLMNENGDLVDIRTLLCNPLEQKTRYHSQSASKTVRSGQRIEEIKETVLPDGTRRIITNYSEREHSIREQFELLESAVWHEEETRIEKIKQTYNDRLLKGGTLRGLTQHSLLHKVNYLIQWSKDIVGCSWEAYCKQYHIKSRLKKKNTRWEFGSVEHPIKNHDDAYNLILLHLVYERPFAFTICDFGDVGIFIETECNRGRPVEVPLEMLSYNPTTQLTLQDAMEAQIKPDRELIKLNLRKNAECIMETERARIEGDMTLSNEEHHKLIKDLGERTDQYVRAHENADSDDE